MDYTGDEKKIYPGTAGYRHINHHTAHFSCLLPFIDFEISPNCTSQCISVG